MLASISGLFARSNPTDRTLEYIRARQNGVPNPPIGEISDGENVLIEEIEVLFDERQALDRYVGELEAELAAHRGREQRIERAFSEFSEVMQACASGQLHRRLEEADELGVEDDFNVMMDELDQTVQLLEAFVTAVVESTEAVLEDSDAITEASDQIADSVGSITRGADEQTHRLNQLNEEMELLSSSVEEIASVTTAVAALSEKTAETGRHGRVEAENAMAAIEAIEGDTQTAVDTIETLFEQMDHIGMITDLITDLAEQTNMLALNANIEAARSEGNEEGFGVVAAQVKDLSNETVEAAEEIEQRLELVEQNTHRAREAVTQVNDRVTEHGESIERAADALEDIAEYATKTDAGVQEIDEAANTQAASVQHVVALAEETGEISRQTAALTEAVSTETTVQAERLGAVNERTQDLVTDANRLQDTLEMFNVSKTEQDPLDALDTGTTDPVSESAPTSASDLETQFATASAVGDDSFETSVEAATEAFAYLNADRVDFCQVFCSSRYDYDEVIQGIRSVIGDEAELIGCSSSGEFTEHCVAENSVTVALAASDTIQFYTGMGTGLRESVPKAIGRATEALPESVPGYPHRSAINLHDGLSGMGDQIALVTLRKLGQDVNIVGGSAGDDMAMEATHVFCNDEVREDAVVIALLASRRPAMVAVNHGHHPISEPLTVTRADGSRVYELDGRPAFEVWREYTERHIESARSEAVAFGPDADERDRLRRLFTEYEFGIEEGTGIGDDRGYKTRWPGLTETTDGPLDFPVNVPEGTKLRVMYSPKDAQIEAARKTADEAVAFMEDADAEMAGGFVYDCVCRAAILEEKFPDAVRAMADEFTAPFAGFETYGELCVARGQNSGFHNTSSVALVLPK